MSTYQKYADIYRNRIRSKERLSNEQLKQAIQTVF